MIRPIDIRLNAAHPELKPPEAVTYTGSPSTVFIRGVPPNYGRWAITAVSVAATFPDGSTTTRAAVQSANGVWVATLPATATSGRTTDGFRVIADGIDENGEAATGYILAVADFAVASLDVTPAPQPGETSWQMLYFDAVPSVLRKGDVAKIDGVLKFYNGTAWEAFAAPVTLDDTVTSSSANGVKSSGIWSAIWGALTALPTGFASLYDWVVDQLAGKASKSDATLTEKWTPTFALTTAQKELFSLTPGASDNDYALTIVPSSSTDSYTLYVGSYGAAALRKDPSNSTNLIFNGGDARLELQEDDLVATLSGYQLGSQTGKPIASEAEAEALRTGKADKPSTFTTGNLAKFDANGNPTDAGKSIGDMEPILIAAQISGSGEMLSVFALVKNRPEIAEIPTTFLTRRKLDSTSAAPAFTAKTYVVNDLCTYNSAIYRCKVGYTATASSVKPNADTTHWEAKPVGDLFLPLTGGTMTGGIQLGASYLRSSQGQLDQYIGPGYVYINTDGDSSHSPEFQIFLPWKSGTFALTADVPYSLGTPTIIDTASSEVVEGQTVYYGAAMLADRTANIVQVIAATPLDELRITFPAATSGKVRDFGLRVEIGTGSAALAAPALVPIAPTGETIKIENNAAEIPALADGTATAKGVTLLYFSETAPGVFVVKGEQVEEVA